MALSSSRSTGTASNKPWWSSFLDSWSVIPTEDDNTVRITPMDLFNPLHEVVVSEGGVIAKPEDKWYSSCDDDNDDEDVSCTCSSSFHSTSTSTQSGVSFHERVEVIQIPSHRDFAVETRLAMWETPVEFQANLERNMVEFFVDGGNWRTATEESHFAPLPTGEFVHPATWMRSAPLYSPGRKHRGSRKRPQPYRRRNYTPRHIVQQAPPSHSATAQYHQCQTRDEMPRCVVSTSAA